MLQRLLIELARIKTEITSENLLNVFHHILYLLHQSKELTENVYNRIMNSKRYNTKWMLYL